MGFELHDIPTGRRLQGLKCCTMDRETIDIVLECAAALEKSAFDGTVRDAHYAHINRLLASGNLEVSHCLT
jgi:hypothetical protein